MKSEDVRADNYIEDFKRDFEKKFPKFRILQIAIAKFE